MKYASWRVVFIISVVCGLGAAAQAQTLDWLAETKAVRWDPHPEQTTRGLHFVISDERRHDLFREAIQDSGGVYMGVGTNQNYLMAAWAKPQYLVIVDFDQVVVDLHAIYRVLFSHFTTPDEFVEVWQKKNRPVMFGLFRQYVPRGAKRRAVREVFRRYRRRVKWGLEDARQRAQELGYPSFLTDQEQYDTLRQLFLQDRVFVVRGDFSGKKSLRDIGALLHEHHLEVSVLYLSNVEQYVRWHHGRFRRNMLGLPFADHGKVLRTYGWGPRLAADHNYRYYIQPGQLFQAWLQTRSRRGFKRLLRSGQTTETVGYLNLVLTPKAYVEAQVAKKRPRKKPPPATAVVAQGERAAVPAVAPGPPGS